MSIGKRMNLIFQVVFLSPFPLTNLGFVFIPQPQTLDCLPQLGKFRAGD